MAPRARDAWEGDHANLDDYRAHAGFERGVSGFVVHTVPSAVFCALRAEDVRLALEYAVRLGGDTDTTGAIVGALVGARDGAAALPRDWLEGIRDWPVSVGSLRALAESVAMHRAAPPQRWIASVSRNMALLVMIAELGTVANAAYPRARSTRARGGQVVSVTPGQRI